MLKINLLPIRQLKKQAKAKKELLGMLGLFILVLAILAIAGSLQARKISGLEVNIAKLQTEKDSYTPTLNKIAKLKKEKIELVRRTEIINKLKTDSSLTVRLLDEVANRIDNQRMWLDFLQQQGSSLSLSGVALDNQTIAKFMDNLEASPFVKDVTLTASSLKNVSGKNLKSFQLACVVGQPAKQTPETKAVK